MNRAARCARGDLLCFLHADSSLLSDDLLAGARRVYLAASGLEPSQMLAGHFGLRFLARDGGERGDEALRYRFLEAKTRESRRWTTNGDQGLMVARSSFWELGGFSQSRGFLEDQEFVEELRRRGGSVITLPGSLGTSSRRFEVEGFWRRYGLMSMIMAMYVLEQESFFAQAPRLYRRQDELDGLLDLRPFLRQALGQLGQMEPGARARLLEQLGELLAQNAWQVALWLDVASGFAPARRPFLCAYDDRLREPVQRLLPFRALGRATILAAAILDLVLEVKGALAQLRKL